MDAWEDVCGVRFVEIDDSPHSDIRIGWMPWADSDGVGGPSNTLGYAWRQWSTGSFGKKVIVAIAFDPAESWDSESFYDTALHEVGHSLGIKHSDVHNVVLSGQPTTPYSDQPGRDVLQPDDIAAAQALFGPPSRFDLIGTSGDDRLFGSDEGDTIKGGFGNDTIVGGSGDDVLAGNGVYWTHWNNPQDNYWSRTFDGSTDRDSIDGGAGNDFINGNAGADDLRGGTGNDTIFGGQNEGEWTAGRTRTNTIHLRDGVDELRGGSGDDFLNGNMGRDHLWGGDGHDLMRGGQDNDWLFGGDGNDTIFGDLESDVFLSGDGSDAVVLGNDPGYGDGAVDRVVFLRSNSGVDTVYGFEMHDVVYILDYWPANRGESLWDATPSTPSEAEALGLAVFHYIV